MLQRQHSQLNSPCKYTEMKARSQMFFADLSRFHSILLDTSVQRLSSPYYGRACNVCADFGKRNAPEACGLSGALAVFHGWDGLRSPGFHL